VKIPAPWRTRGHRNAVRHEGRMWISSILVELKGKQGQSSFIFHSYIIATTMMIDCVGDGEAGLHVRRTDSPHRLNQNNQIPDSFLTVNVQCTVSPTRPRPTLSLAKSGLALSRGRLIYYLLFDKIFHGAIACDAFPFIILIPLLRDATTQSGCPIYSICLK
jgi:hypothetical protein